MKKGKERMARAFLKVFFDFEERTERLSEEERGRLLLGMLRYAQHGEEPELPGNEGIIWPVFRAEIDEAVASYDTKVANGSRGGRPPKAESEAEKPEPDETEKNRNKPKKTGINRNAQEQEQEKEQDRFDDDDDLSARAREEAVEESFRENIGREAMPEEVRQISRAAGMMGMDPELAGEAVRLAAKYGALHPVSYAVEVLDDWRSRGVKTIEEADRLRYEEDCRRGKTVSMFREGQYG